MTPQEIVSRLEAKAVERGQFNPAYALPIIREAMADAFEDAAKIAYRFSAHAVALAIVEELEDKAKEARRGGA